MVVYIVGLDVWLTVYDMYINGIQPISFVAMFQARGSYLSYIFNSLSYEYWIGNILPLLIGPSVITERILNTLNLVYYLLSALCALIVLVFNIYAVVYLIAYLITTLAFRIWSSPLFRLYLLISVILIVLLPINNALGETFGLFCFNYLVVFLIIMWPPKK